MALNPDTLVKRIYLKRKPASKKRDFGKVLVIGGSKVFTGAPALSAMAALRSGADLVVVAAPERAADTVASFSPDMITVPFEGDFFSEKHAQAIEELVLDADAVVIGPGLGREKKTMAFVKKILPKIKIPCVIDADALYVVMDVMLHGNFVLTPHRGEFRMLLGEEHGKDASKKLAKKTGAIIIAKGPVDFISDGKNVYPNKTGTPYMTTGGTGDVLAGVCAAILARGTDSFEAACAGAYITGLAGEAAAKKFGDGLVGSDVINELPKIIMGLY
ncbi:MAG: NAD(P)H-hydrate dehydratase [Candidatus Aenigmarchaeota archaeon]|nr:NAD(P)H-hydrate dehydratase [Candidatus Aenigmarchaeota archaeon]